MNIYSLYSLCFRALVIAYSLQTPDDLTCKLLIGLQLLQASCIFATKSISQRGTYKNNTSFIVLVCSTLLLLLSDLTYKIVCTLSQDYCLDPLSQQLNFNIVQQALNFKFGLEHGLYAGSLFMCIVILLTFDRIVPVNSLTKLKESAVLFIDSGRYVCIGLLYTIAYIDTGIPQAAWTIMCIIYTVCNKYNHHFLKIVCLLLSLLIYADFLRSDPELSELMFPFYKDHQYQLDYIYIEEILCILKILVLLLVSRQLYWCINFRPAEVQEPSELLPLRKRKSSINENILIYKIYIIHASTLGILLTHTSPGCIILAIALGLNIDNTGAWYRHMLLSGSAVCLIWQPNNIVLFSYFLLVYWIRPVWSVRKFELWWLVYILRLAILFSHVSVINFVAGLITNPYLILSAIVLRISARIIGFTNEIIGFGDNYGLTNNEQSPLADILLWLLYIAIKVQGQASRINRFLMWLAEILSWTLHILRYFHWIAYTVICCLVLSEDQSIISLIEFCLVLALISCDMMLGGLKKNIQLKRLWTVYIYWTFFTIAVRYFYLFSQYQPSWSVFNFLHKYQKFIGLVSPDAHPQKAFLPSCIALLVSVLSRYIQSIKVMYRNIEMNDVRVDNRESVIGTAFSRVRLTINPASAMAEDTKFVYETFIAPKRLDDMGNRISIILRVLFKPLLDLTYVVIALMYMYEGSLEYILYGLIAIWHIVKVHISPNNMHELYDKTQINTENLKQSALQCSKAKTEANKKALTLTIGVSVAIILLSYLKILFNAIYYGNFQSDYKFVSILPQFTIVIVSIIAKKLSVSNIQEHNKAYEQLIIHVVSQNRKTVLTAMNTIIKILHKLLIINCSVAVLNKDVSSVLTVVLLITYKVNRVPEKWLVMSIQLLAVIGIAEKNFSYITQLILGRLLMYAKFKASQTYAHNPQPQEHQPQQNFWGVLQHYLPTMLLLMALPFPLYSLSIVNLPLFLIIVWCIIYREILRQPDLAQPAEQPKTIRIAIYIMYGIAILLFVMKTFQEHFWMNRPGIVLFLSLLSLLDDLLSYGQFGRISEQGRAYIRKKGLLVGQIMNYLENEFKLDSLRRHYLEKEKMTRNIQRIKQELQNSKKQAFISNTHIDLEQEQLIENKYRELWDCVLFYPTPQLHKIIQKFNHYLPEDHVNQQTIQTINQEIVNNFQYSFSRTLSKMLRIPQKEHDSELTSIEFEDEYQNHRSQLINDLTVEQHKSYYLKMLVSNFDYIGYIFLIGWNFYGGVYTLPANILIFSWAIPAEGRTPLNFWKWLLYYVLIILGMKYLIGYFPEITLFNFVFSTARKRTMFEYLLVCVLIAQIISDEFFGGQSLQVERVEDGLFRTVLNRSSFGIIKPQSDETFLKYYKTVSQKKTNNFISDLFSKHNLKPGKDYYPFIASSQVAIFIYIFFLYDMIELENKKNTTTIQDIFGYNQFTKHMVIALFLQMIVMIVDRVVTTYNYYDAGEQQLQSFLLSYTFGSSYRLQLQTIQMKTEYDVPLIIKYVCHLVVLLSVNIFVFMYIPAASHVGKQCQNVDDCGQRFIYLMGFFALYLVYFFFNALQIKYGFTRLKGKNILMTSYHFVSMYIYKAFLAVPFLVEFKKLSDWTFTATALPLFHWLKFQDMHSRLFVCKCQTEMLKRKPYGVETWWVKYIIAPVGFISIILIFFGPLVIYSTVNPFAVMDEVTSAEVDLAIVSNTINLEMFQTSHVNQIENIRTENSSEVYGGKYKSLYYIEMSRFPDYNSKLSEPVLENLMLEMDKTINRTHNMTFKMIMKVVIDEREGGKTKIEWASYQFDTSTLKKLRKLISGELSTLTIRDFYSPLPGRMKNIPLTIKASAKYWEVSSNGQVLPLYYITRSKFKIQFGIVSFYLTYVLLISRLFRIYLVANVENAIFEGPHLQKVLYLCSGVISARRLQNFKEQQYFYFELMDLIRSPQKMYQTTGNFVQLRKEQCHKP